MIFANNGLHRRQLLRSALIAVALTCAFILTLASAVMAYGDNECVAARYNSNLGCTAADVSITGISVAPGTPTACVGGSSFTANLDITVNFAQPDRYDVGIFLSRDGKTPKLLPASGGADSCTVGILPTISPFTDIEQYGSTDTCGDGNPTINGGTGSGIVRLYDVPVLCQAVDLSNGKLFIPFVVSWDHQKRANCTSIADALPGTTSKCNSPNTLLATNVEYGSINVVVLPSISKSDGKTALSPGAATTYTVVITNTTGAALSNVVFTDPVAPNLTVSTVSCSAIGTTCPATTVAAMQGAGITIPAMPVNSSVTFAINATLAASPAPSGTRTVTNTASVSVTDKSTSASDTNTIIGANFPDLSTSTKGVLDKNGDDLQPGDVLRYTITLKENSGYTATGVSVTDNIPANVNNFTVISIPAGAGNSSTTGGGTNGTGYLNLTGITVPASGSVTIVFEVTVAAATPAGTPIANSATVTNPGGLGGTPAAPTLTVQAATVTGSGNKLLYLYDSTSTPAHKLSRTPNSSTSYATIALSGLQRWTMDPGAAAAITIDPKVNSTVPVYLLLRYNSNPGNRTVKVDLQCSSGGTTLTNTKTINLTINQDMVRFDLSTPTPPWTTPVTCAAGNRWELTVTNTAAAVTDSMRVYITNPTWGRSRVELPASTVINVDSITYYDAAYPAGSVVTSAAPGKIVYIRSTISDPFGSYDINASQPTTLPTLTLTKPDGTVAVTARPMTELSALTTPATKTFEYGPYTLNTSGNWTALVHAFEGTEGTVSDYGIKSASVISPLPSLLVIKSAQTFSDPINGTSLPKAIPGAFMTYTISVSNTGPGAVDNNSTVITDPIPANTELFVGDINGAGSGPVLFTDGPIPSGLSYTFTSLASTTDNLAFSGNNGADIYLKSNTAPDSNQCDPSVTDIKIPLSGTFNGSDGTNHPAFNVKFRVRIK
ncbi:MAG: hypothetical protein CVU69_03820 [Deltaproteobacteria bacterium HGW-Deltaproteobacteria-4]|nr:MAG: hypothetical protein CVU69_03820 [Deltaproteobacteria bacterium HGW-Deltaproteobacteria-4]